MIDWPSTLPLPSLNLAGEVRTAVIRTEMDTGRVRQRDRFGTVVNNFSVEWLFSSEEWETFKTFFHTTLKNGVLWFNLPLPDTGTLDPVSVRFAEAKFSRSYVPHMQWRISAAIEQEVIQEHADPEIDIMPLLRQDVIEVTEDLTLSMTHQNKLLCCNPGVGETITITLPLNANFTTVFSCGFTKEGAGEVIFDGESGVVVDSPEGALRIFRTNTPVTCTYRAANRFKLMGSLY